MKIVGIEANYYENGNGVEVMARFTDADGEELTACVSDYDSGWSACVGRGFTKADEEPWDETVCDYRDKDEAKASEYGKLFEMMAELAVKIRAF